MRTPIFRVFAYAKALEFYIGWLGFQLDWEEQPKNNPAYVQISRDTIVLHLAVHPGKAGPGATARAAVRGLPACHRMLTEKTAAFARPGPSRAPRHERVLEMETVDLFGNLIIFCEPGALLVGTQELTMSATSLE